MNWHRQCRQKFNQLVARWPCPRSTYSNPQRRRGKNRDEPLGLLPAVQSLQPACALVECAGMNKVQLLFARLWREKPDHLTNGQQACRRVS
jgi:hypothetical protein